VRWTIKLVEEMRDAIRAGTFSAHRANFLASYTPPDGTVRDAQRAKWAAAHTGR
jgi:queuine/archaeosine tRNA-ribosyltransferase